MNKFLTVAAFFLLSPSAVKAQIYYAVAFSSQVYSNISISSLTATRVDNQVIGATSYVLVGRNQLLLNIPHTSAAIAFDCLYSSAGATAVTISTTSGNANFGQEYESQTADTRQTAVPINTNMSYWCQAEGPASGSFLSVNVIQSSPFVLPIIK